MFSNKIISALISHGGSVIMALKPMVFSALVLSSGAPLVLDISSVAQNNFNAININENIGEDILIIGESDILELMDAPQNLSIQGERLLASIGGEELPASSDSSSSPNDSSNNISGDLPASFKGKSSQSSASKNSQNRTSGDSAPKVGNVLAPNNKEPSPETSEDLGDSSDSTGDNNSDPSQSAPVAESESKDDIQQNLEELIELSYSDPDGDEASSCSIEDLSNLVESTPCQCSSGVCQVGITSDLDYAGGASFEFLVVANGQDSNRATIDFDVYALGGPYPGNHIDMLNGKNYGNDNGSLSWSDDWQESGEFDGAMAGVLQIDNKAGSGPNQCASGNCLRIGSDLGESGEFSLARELNLSGAGASTLNFSWRKDASLGFSSNQDVLIQMSKDNGVSWQTVFSISPGAGDPAVMDESVDVSSYLHHNSKIRITTQNSSGISGFLYIDDIEFDNSP